MNDIKYGRKRKGIIKQLNEKLSAWVDSIEDEDVKKAVRKNTIITGGSIASMLLGEPVNDYDVYFKDKETTKLVAEYYVKKYNDSNSINTAEGVTPYQPFVKQETMTNCKGEDEERVLIYIKSAGVAGSSDAEYDYFESREDGAAEEYVESVIPNETKETDLYKPVFLSQNAITLSGKMQIIIRFYGEPDKIHSNYDFVHAMNYYDYSSGHLELKLEALESLMSRTLVYKGSLYPICSIWRAKKFINRGWRISAGQLLKIMWQISELNLKDYNVVKEQLIGVDATYLHQLIEALKDVDMESVDSTYIGVLIDRIFGD